MPTVLGVKDASQRTQESIEKTGMVLYRRKQFSLIYYVLGDYLAQPDAEILLATGIPPLGFPLYGAFCINREPSDQGTVQHPVSGLSVQLWEVRCSFDSNYDSEKDNEDPTNQRPTIRWFGETQNEVLERDAITGEAVRTAAGEPIIVEIQYVTPVLEISRIQAAFSPQTILDSSHHTNANDFYGAPEGCALMLPMDAEEVMINEATFVRVAYRRKFKLRMEGGNFIEDGWMARVLHQGHLYRRAVGAVPQVFQDDKGVVHTINLNGEGPPHDFAGGDGTERSFLLEPHYLQFNRYEKTDFDTLSLGPL